MKDSKLIFIPGKVYYKRSGEKIICSGTRIDYLANGRVEISYLFPMYGAGNYAVQANGRRYFSETEDDILHKEQVCTCCGKLK